MNELAFIDIEKLLLLVGLYLAYIGFKYVKNVVYNLRNSGPGLDLLVSGAFSVSHSIFNKHVLANSGPLRQGIVRKTDAHVLADIMHELYNYTKSNESMCNVNLTHDHRLILSFNVTKESDIIYNFPTTCTMMH